MPNNFKELLDRSTMPLSVQPALCLDLDGTIRHSKSGKTFIEGPEDVAVFPGVKEKLWEYSRNNWLILGFSNQGGVAHGFKTKTSYKAELNAMLDLLKEGEESVFDFCGACCHDPKGKVAPYNVRSLARKPSYGMLAVAEYIAFKEAAIVIDWDNSIFVGDRLEDASCAEAADIGFFWAWEFFGRPTPKDAPDHPYASRMHFAREANALEDKEFLANLAAAKSSTMEPKSGP